MIGFISSYSLGIEIVKKRKEKTLEAKALISFLEKKYGSLLKLNNKAAFLTWPYDTYMSDPFYGYVNMYHKTQHYDFFRETEIYGLVLLKKKSQEDFKEYNPIYKHVSKSKTFIKSQISPIDLNERFVLFVHKNLITKNQN